MHEIDAAVELERRRIIGRLLNAVGVYRLAGHEQIADAIDRLAMDIETESVITEHNRRVTSPR